MKVYELRYTNTNTYLIEGSCGFLLFDTGWAGTMPQFLAAMGALGIPVQQICYVLISHFHPDHMGIAQEIAGLGPVIAVTDVQRDYVHAADAVLQREPKNRFQAIRDDAVKVFSLSESRAFLKDAGIDGEILHTPGHSDDSISLLLDSGDCFVGDLNPLYELEIHKGTEIGRSWEKILAKKPKRVYYGHAKTAVLVETEGFEGNSPAEACSVKKPEGQRERGTAALGQDDLFRLVSRIMKLIDKKMPLSKIAAKTGTDETFVTDVARMYLTHQNVGVQGILDRIEIKNR